MSNLSFLLDDAGSKKIFYFVVFLFWIIMFSFVGENTYFSKTENSGRRKIFWSRVFFVALIVTIVIYIISNYIFGYGHESTSWSNDTWSDDKVSEKRQSDGSRTYKRRANLGTDESIVKKFNDLKL